MRPILLLFTFITVLATAIPVDSLSARQPQNCPFLARVSDMISAMAVKAAINESWSQLELLLFSKSRFDTLHQFLNMRANE